MVLNMFDYITTTLEAYEQSKIIQQLGTWNWANDSE